MTEAPDWVHASCVAVAGAGILIRGASGAGKSRLALFILDRCALEGRSAGLVGDDRIGLSHVGPAIMAQPHPALRNRIEIRGLGLVPVSGALASASIRLVVDLVEACPRLPEAPLRAVPLLGRDVPGLVLDRAMLGAGLAPRLVLDALTACPGAAAGPRAPLLAFPSASEP